MLVIAKHHDVLQKLGLTSVEGVKAFRGELVKDHKGRRDVSRIMTADASGGKLVLYLKRSWKPYRKNGLTSLLLRGRVWSSSREEWENCRSVSRAGLQVAVGVAFGEECSWLWERFSFIVTEAAGPPETLLAYLRECRSPRERRRVLDALALEVRRLHEHGLATPDLFARHIFVDGSTEPPLFRFIDMARLDRRRRVSMRLRARDLAALNVSAPLNAATARERIRFLDVYCGKRDRKLLERVRRRVRHRLARGTRRRFFEAASG